MREDEATYPFWIDEEPGGRTARIGLAEGWIETLGEEPVGCELLPAGTRLAPGETLGFLHTPTRVLDLRTPMALEILTRNDDALADARRITASPYGRGWLAEVRLLR